ncbi:MAG: metallophosphoesterase [Chloracidobacterium sp.]|nr:metallophosphoesterase [Chloracidobacterium sp.]
MFDPFPAISVGLHAFDQWPGFLCWSHSGKATFIRENRIDEFLKALDSAHFDEVLEHWSWAEASAKKRLLHLSDLHFGTDDAIRNKRMLLAELSEVVHEVDRIVITGDLFDSPKESFALHFAEFCDKLTEISGGKAPIYIPGNHDIRVRGILGKSYEQIANIRPTTVEIDDDAKMVFIGFNTSENGFLAQGSISKVQLTRIGSEYRDLLARNSRAKDYLPVVLIHHHPFSYENEPVGALEKAFRYLGMSLEPTLRMENPADFYKWCADWKFETVLHGHKHSAKHIKRNVGSHAEPFELTAIGCGSSLGAEGSPVSYNLLEWDQASENWIVSFHQSENGGAFKEKAVALSF